MLSPSRSARWTRSAGGILVIAGIVGGCAERPMAPPPAASATDGNRPDPGLITPGRMPDGQRDPAPAPSNRTDPTRPGI